MQENKNIIKFGQKNKVIFFYFFLFVLVTRVQTKLMNICIGTISYNEFIYSFIYTIINAMNLRSKMINFSDNELYKIRTEGSVWIFKEGFSIDFFDICR